MPADYVHEMSCLVSEHMQYMLLTCRTQGSLWGREESGGKRGEWREAGEGRREAEEGRREEAGENSMEKGKRGSVTDLLYALQSKHGNITACLYLQWCRYVSYVCNVRCVHSTESQ